MRGCALGDVRFAPLRVLILANSSSGAGKAAALVASARDDLVGRGHRVSVLTVPNGATPHAERAGFGAEFRRRLADADLLVVAGGDGTIHHVLDAVVERGIPLYHFPFGTENLFARDFAMRNDPGALLRAIDAGRTALVDVGVIDPAPLTTPPGAEPWDSRLFAIMCSVGPDAAVVHRLAAIRRGPISHFSYLRPVMDEMHEPWLPVVSIEVNGREIVHQRKGMVVVANSRQYAARVDPAFHARNDDGLLDVVFFPADTGIEVVGWLLRSRFRMNGIDGSGAIHAAARTIRVTSQDASPRFQVDGEAGPPLTRLDLSFSLHPARLRVLLGAGAAKSPTSPIITEPWARSNSN